MSQKPPEKREGWPYTDVPAGPRVEPEAEDPVVVEARRRQLVTKGLRMAIAALMLVAVTITCAYLVLGP